MSHTTTARRGNFRLSLIHNSDHSGPSELVLVETISGVDVVRAEVRLPEGEIARDLARMILDLPSVRCSKRWGGTGSCCKWSEGHEGKCSWER